MTATATREVLHALVSRFRADLPSQVEVTNGEPLHLNAAEVLSVGYSANRPSVEVVQTIADMGEHRHESLSVACLASSLRGEMDDASARRVLDEADALLDAVKTSLAADPSLGGLVDTAEIGLGLTFDQAIARDADGRGRGLVALIEFTIAVTVL